MEIASMSTDDNTTPRRRGRPPGSTSANPRRHTLRFRATAEEKARYEQAAASAGLPMSEWLRTLADAEADRLERLAAMTGG